MKFAEKEFRASVLAARLFLSAPVPELAELIRLTTSSALLVPAFRASVQYFRPSASGSLPSRSLYRPVTYSVFLV